MKVALIGATGMVGRTMLQVLEERRLTLDTVIPVGSAASIGRELAYKGRPIHCVSLEDALHQNPDFALFSAGSAVSLEWAPLFAAKGTTVIDNSSAWRMDSNCPLVVPQINGASITETSKIIANPNCSTIQMVMALAPLHHAFKIKRIVVSTYQSVTGTGKDAVVQMEEERNVGKASKPVYLHPIDRNCIPHCDVFLDNDYTKEEMKLVHETRKILGDQDIQITATAVRVPVVGGHSEAVNVEFYQDFDKEEVIQLLQQMNGVTVMDNPKDGVYPTPLESMNKDEVFVGRIRRDESQPNTLNLWIVSDNLRKGAATNAIEIMEHLNQKKTEHASRIF